MDDPTYVIPQGYEPIELFGGDGRDPVNLCVLVKQDPEPGAGRFVTLRDGLDSRVVLGCLTDAGGVVREWLEVAIQSTERVSEMLPAYHAALTNHGLNERWSSTVAAVDEVFPGDLHRVGLETGTPGATFLDTSKRQVVGAVHEPSGETFEVCRDDEVLRDFELPAFTTTVHRYLWIPSLGHNSPMVSVSRDAPRTNAVMPMDELLVGANRNLVPLNPGGGLMLVRRHSPVTMSGFIDLLSGASEPGLVHGTSVLRVRSDEVDAERTGGESVDPDRLFLGRHGRWGRLVETLHLKLRLLADCVANVEGFARHTRRPILGLSDESFRVDWWDRSCGLPRFWTAKAVLRDPGGAVALPLEQSETTYFVSPDGLGKGIYRPQTSVEAPNGRCSLRTRAVHLSEDGTVVVEGTFETEERVRGGSDLVELRLVLDDRRINLFAHLERDRAMAAGEMRFRSVPHRFSDEDTASLRSSEGVPMRDVSFEVLPLLSTPCDLYSLGVLGVRALLVDEGTTLPIALDEMLSLCRQVGQNAGGDPSDLPPLHERIAVVFEGDSRWRDSLGPQRLTHEGVSVEEAFDLIPPELWFRALGVLLRMFPGTGPDSVCRDLGDVRPTALHRVFEPVREDLDTLMIRTRSLMVIDWRYNREVHGVVRGFRTGMVTAGGA